MTASLLFNYGRKGCGKTTSMLLFEHYYRKCGYNPLIIKHISDRQEEDSNGFGHFYSEIVPNKHQALFVEKISEQHLNNIEFNMLLVDDVHKFTPQDMHELVRISKNRNIQVACFGLEKDDNGKPYPASQELMKLTHDVYASRMTKDKVYETI